MTVGEGLRKWMETAVFDLHTISEWNPDTMAQIFMKLDELRHPLILTPSAQVLNEYVGVIALAANFLIEYPDPRAARELCDRALHELAAIEWHADSYGLTYHQVSQRLDICVRHLEVIEQTI